uniref:BTB/POZ domain-containing family protein n=1 Tax=Rhizophora mucronata TaxID=61149 RepID=A0A2P2L4P9_RHIMU
MTSKNDSIMRIIVPLVMVVLAPNILSKHHGDIIVSISIKSHTPSTCFSEFQILTPNTLKRCYSEALSLFLFYHLSSFKKPVLSLRHSAIALGNLQYI